MQYHHTDNLERKNGRNKGTNEKTDFLDEETEEQEDAQNQNGLAGEQHLSF